MKSVKFVILGRLSGTNDIIRYAAYNRYAGGAVRKMEKVACANQINAQNLRHNASFSNAVGISFSWIEPNNKRDIDNVTGGQKVILDALVMCGVLPNDNRKWVRVITHTFPESDKLNPRIEVTVTEIE